MLCSATETHFTPVDEMRSAVLVTGMGKADNLFATTHFVRTSHR